MNLKISVANIAAAPPGSIPYCLHSPVLQDTSLDRSLGCQLVAKVETDNPVGSFKGPRHRALRRDSSHARTNRGLCVGGNSVQGLARAAGAEDTHASSSPRRTPIH